MNEKAPREELPSIEFDSPGRFSIHNPEPAPPRIDCEPAPFWLGDTVEPQRFATPHEIRLHALAMLQQARRSLCIYTPDLEHWLYDRPSVQLACSQFLRAHPRNQVRILVTDTGRAVRDGHRLLALSRRLPGSLQLRKPLVEGEVIETPCLIADDCGLLLRPHADRHEGIAYYSAAGLARRYRARFDLLWNQAEPDPDLRSFLL